MNVFMSSENRTAILIMGKIARMRIACVQIGKLETLEAIEGNQG